MNDAIAEAISTTDCDREPIHIPEAIQPHGLLFVVDRGDQTVLREAGLMSAITGRDSWIGQPISTVLGEAVARRMRTVSGAEGDGFAGRWRAANRLEYDIIVRESSGDLIVEVEQSSQGAQLGVELITRLDAAGVSLERAATVRAVCEKAAEAFRTLTGFDRVMIYRFLEDDAGQVVAESKDPDLQSFQNHHFPATDIPRQARALYVRNHVRVIPDARYTPQPLLPQLPGKPLDMSDCGLRSVSPVHLKYLDNMGVRASASVSIVIDGDLWGLIACHSSRPQLLPFELRMAAVNLARSMARQIKAKGEAELYRERMRLRHLEDELIGRMPTDRSLMEALTGRTRDLADLVDADGFAVVSDGDIVRFGVTPPDEAILTLAGWVADQPSLRPLATHALSQRHAEAAAWRTEASGLLGVHLHGDQPLTLLWFRAEIIETVRWAGNPTTATKSGPAGVLTPRASFEAWSETVQGRSRRWSPAAVESAQRLRDALIDFAAVSKLRHLNRSLQASVSERDVRLEQQAFLIREVNHRVQNSLTLVSSFLGLQARQSDPATQAALMEARRRVRAVSMVHSRLYRAETGSTVDLSRYFAELVEDLGASMGADWSAQLTSDLAPVSIEAGRAVTIGLVLTELIINAQKYAYDGAAGPIRVVLTEDKDSLRLIVEDAGKGGHAVGDGFGSMMIGSLVGQLGGQIDYRDARPGLSVLLRAPLGTGAA
ncbi:histidine kinase dimerization/phosphoacceptor domain -containing protein [Brevundimonas sp. Root1423]|uniref:histidine kinase dimerization/phosphoacceptor domain -containing protein n=1 Tax=Brevundimonas sp. Root1423 TaxID=1736462 RepID=UPI0006FF4219|nr:histidine kinase dimerization/phosphoacceptor domain -containing protein [Brevundimonas sp. Root1423]KQY96478.1 histidine kinase [Brevundimonas sp. Root1423]